MFQQNTIGNQNPRTPDPFMVKDKWTVFKHIYDTGFNHRGDLENAKTTYIIFTVNNESCTIIENSKEIQAEEMITDELSKKLKIGMGRGKIDIEIYMNNSPCRNCANDLLEFLASHRLANMTIHFSNLYKIRRKSCINEKERIESNNNADGLRMLMDHKRCNLQPFNRTTWLYLIGILGIQSPEFQEDYILQKNGNGRSREDEDSLLQEDLNFIAKREMCMEEVFYKLFNPQPTMFLAIVYAVNNENKARFSTRAINGQLKEKDEDFMEEFLRDLEKTYTLKKESEEMHVDIYMLLNVKRWQMLTNFLKKHRKAFLRIYAAEVLIYKDTWPSFRELMDNKRCNVMAFTFSTWTSLLGILGLIIPDLEDEYQSRRGKDISIQKELDNIYYH